MSSVRRVLEGVRVEFRYDRRKLDVTVRPNPDDLCACPPLALLRFWAAVAAWVLAVPKTNPGWTVQGVRVDTTEEQPDDARPDPGVPQPQPGRPPGAGV